MQHAKLHGVDLNVMMQFIEFIHLIQVLFSRDEILTEKFRLDKTRDFVHYQSLELVQKRHRQELK